jgi:glycosyltransferase involved in cell wall biosynthesis
VLIRFANSAGTLPQVLDALRAQSLPPDEILGVASASGDRSRELLEHAGARVIDWTEPYHHSRVLNFGIRHLRTDLILILSSHTVLGSSTVLAELAAAFSDPRVCAASVKWDSDPYYTDAVTWEELQAKGLRFGSIHTNSLGMIRRCRWERTPFDESITTSEDYAWAIERLRHGDVCRRLALPFSHLRHGAPRHREFADIVFHFSRRYRLPVTWLGARASLSFLARAFWNRRPAHEWRPALDRFLAWVGHGRARLIRRSRPVPLPFSGDATTTPILTA